MKFYPVQLKSVPLEISELIKEDSVTRDILELMMKSQFVTIGDKSICNEYIKTTSDGLVVFYGKEVFLH